MAECTDALCPTHGSLKVGKRTYAGTVTSARMRRTVSVRRELRVLLPKYDRFAKRYSSLKAHNPECMAAKEGDEVTVAECRPISKSKHFVVIAKKSFGMAAESTSKLNAKKEKGQERGAK